MAFNLSVPPEALERSLLWEVAMIIDVKTLQQYSIAELKSRWLLVFGNTSSAYAR